MAVIDLLDHNQIPLPPAPILPYAVSLALTTFYARVREGDGEFIAEYKGCIDKLTYLGEWWWVAGAMAKLGARAMNSGGKRRAVEKECAAVLSSLKGTSEEGKNGQAGVPHERANTHIAAVRGMLRVLSWNEYLLTIVSTYSFFSISHSPLALPRTRNLFRPCHAGHSQHSYLHTI